MVSKQFLHQHIEQNKVYKSQETKEVNKSKTLNIKYNYDNSELSFLNLLKVFTSVSQVVFIHILIHSIQNHILPQCVGSSFSNLHGLFTPSSLIIYALESKLTFWTVKWESKVCNDHFSKVVLLCVSPTTNIDLVFMVWFTSTLMFFVYLSR